MTADDAGAVRPRVALAHTTADRAEKALRSQKGSIL